MRNTFNKATLLTFDAVCLLAIVLILAFGCPTAAYAYVDPSVMTYTIQALAGVAVALSTVIGVAWRRFRRVIYKKFNIDENAGKLVEPDVKSINPSTKEGEKELREANRKTSEMLMMLDVDHQQNRKWIPRLVISLIACAFVVYTVGIIAPFEIVAQSATSLLFGINNILPPLVIFAVILTLVLAFAISAIRGRAFNVVVGIIVAIGICCYIQATFMNTGLPIADGATIAWDDYTSITCITGLVWVLIIAVAVVLAIKNGSVLKSAVVIASTVLILIQSIGLVTVFTNPTVRADGTTSLEAGSYTTNEGLFEVGSSNNVVMFVLDTFDNDYLDEVLEANPEILDGYTGFTWYSDTSGYMIPTAYGLSCILTGQRLDDDDTFYGNDKIKEWYANRNLLDEIKEQGYSVDLYTTEIQRGLSAVPWKLDNLNTLTSYVAPLPVAVNELWRCGLYRDMPWILKPLFTFYTGSLNSSIVAGFSADNQDKTPYVNDDVAYYDSLVEKGLTVCDERNGENGSFKVIHLDGVHPPYYMNADVEYVGVEGSSVEEQSEASLKIVAEYIDQLKELGVYDETTIIVTADHGKWFLQEEIDQTTSPILFIKPAGQGDAQFEEIIVSDIPVSQEDFPATLMQIMGKESSEFGSGISIFDASDPDRIRYYNATSVIMGDIVDYVAIKEWEINGDVQDWNAWRETGREWPIIDG